MSDRVPRARITVPGLQQQKRDGRAIVMVTAYDATFARLADQSDIDVILVGDSLGMVMQGHSHTLEVTLDDVIYHCRCVRRATRYAHVVGDLPFMSYQVSPEQALRSAGRVIQEGGAESIKLEGGAAVVDAVSKVVSAGIPVMGHLGLTPQSVHAFGGFKVQARGPREAELLREDAMRLQDAGAYALVLESIPAQLATSVTQELEIPTIGIGAGAGCDGQVLVMQDLLGLDDQFQPRFVKRFAELAEPVRAAFGEFAAEVRNREFPTAEHSFSTPQATESPADAQPAGPGRKRSM